MAEAKKLKQERDAEAAAAAEANAKLASSSGQSPGSKTTELNSAIVEQQAAEHFNGPDNRHYDSIALTPTMMSCILAKIIIIYASL